MLGLCVESRLTGGCIQYAFDDFAISQVAKLLGKTDDAKKVIGIPVPTKVISYATSSTRLAQATSSIRGTLTSRFRALRTLRASCRYTAIPSHCS